MGAHICSLRPSKSESEKLSSCAKCFTSGSKKNSTSVLEVLKRSCWGQGRIKKSQVISTGEMVIRELTLEDWLTSSPGSNPKGPVIGGGRETQVFKQISQRVCTSSRRVHADLVMEKLVKPEDAGVANGWNASVAAIDGSKDENLKKKVSFRLPEESDILIFYSSEEEGEALISDPVPSPLLVSV